MAELPVWGIHVGVASVRGVKLEKREDGTVPVVAYDRFDFAEDVDDLASLERHGALMRALFHFAKRHDLSKSRVVVSVDAATAFNRYVETPLVEGDSLERILEYEAQQQIPFDLSGVYWAHHVLGTDEKRNVAHVLLFAVRREVVDERLRRLDKVRFPVDAVQIAPLALYDYIAYEGLARDGLAVISIDYDRSDLVICHGKRVWFRSLPTGAFSLVEAVRDELEPRHRVAVRIARGEEKPADPARFAELKEACAERLASELARMIEYYRGTLRDVDLRGILVVPSNPMAPPVSRQLKAATGLEIYQLKGFRKLEIEPGIVTPDIENDAGPWAHAAGLALHGLGLGEISVELVDRHVERDIGVRKTFWAASVAVIFLLVAWMWFASQRRAETLAEETARLETLIGEAEARQQELAAGGPDEDAVEAAAAYEAVGRHRSVAVPAADAVLAVIGRAAEASPGRHPRLIRLETAPAESAGAGADARLVRVVVGIEDAPGEDAAALLAELFEKPLSASPGVGAVELQERFAAADLVDTPQPGIEEKILRRRFEIRRYGVSYRVPEETAR